MWTLYRAKFSVRNVFLTVVLGWVWSTGAVGAAPFYGSLYTPVNEGQAIGPLPDEPPAYYPYQPREIKNLEALPANVRSQVIAHVKGRVGDEFYRRMRFVGGQYVDLGVLRRVNPASRRFRRQIPAYLLHFEFEWPKAGIRHYTASIALQHDGTVLKELDLPAFAAKPEKLALKTLSEVASKLGQTREIDPAMTTATITYAVEGDRLVWHFEQALPGAGPEVKVRTIEVDAHSGAVLPRS